METPDSTKNSIVCLYVKEIHNTIYGREVTYNLIMAYNLFIC